MSAGPTAMVPGGLFAALRPLDPASPASAAWRALGAGACVPNPFYEADYALPAARAFGDGIRLLVVADRPPEEPGARWLALWPFRSSRTRWGVPLPVLVGWTHGFCPLGVPLLDGTEPARALQALCDAPRALGLSPRLLLLNAPADGPFAELLAARTNRRDAAYWAHARGALDLAGLEPARRAGYLDHVSGKGRRKLRLGRERLEAGGAVAFETVADPAALAAALDDYVALETAGWKGRAGTALGQRPAEAAFMRGMVAGFGAQGRIRIVRLRRNGRTLAAAILPRSGTEAFVLKVSYDEAEAAGAPGVQLVHRLTEAALRDGAIDRIDSCAAPDYRLAEMFWTGRRAIAHRLVEASPDRFFPLAAALEHARERYAGWRMRRRVR
ncbi:GNAT family N-acetyltransferase [Methylobacterium sp. WL12]|uniref:GNAT family N-acetyltransferase n=1 Tax=Methylobacterium sp. WL12 TaxID=2603890 RepID=UPI0011CBB4DD|nr:GNAT family N-acetyltransferase [Methylobacterium sp. WL12]TXM67713.1 GNAT family N-acetyltransferase [Methylobacterium sp. WL12]